MWTSSFSVLCLLQQPSHGPPSKTLRGNLVLTTSPKDTLTHCEQESYGHLPSARPTEPQLPILGEKLPFCTQPFCRQPQRSLGGAGVLSLAGSRCHPGEPGDIKASSQEETNAAPRWTRDAPNSGNVESFSYYIKMRVFISRPLCATLPSRRCAAPKIAAASGLLWKRF